MKTLTIIFSILLANLALADAALMPGKRALVLYQDGDNVFLKRCESLNSFPANRNCGGTIIGSMPHSQFIRTLPLAPEGFELSDAGLSAARSALQAAITQKVPERQIWKLRVAVYFLELCMDILVHLDPNQDIDLNQHREKYLKLLIHKPLPENEIEKLGRTVLKEYYTELMVFFDAVETQTIVNGKEVRYVVGGRAAKDAEKFCAALGPNWKTPTYKNANNKLADALSNAELKQTIEAFKDLIIYEELSIMNPECFHSTCELFQNVEGRGFPGAKLGALEGETMHIIRFQDKGGSAEAKAVWGSEASDIVCVKLP